MNKLQEKTAIITGGSSGNVKSKQVFVCPDDVNGQISGLTYAMNGCLLSPTVTPTGICPGLTFSKFEYPSNMALLVEESDVNVLANSTDDGYFSKDNTFSLRHNNGSEIVFIDGQVKFFNNGQLSMVVASPTNPANTYRQVLTGGGSAPYCQ